MNKTLIEIDIISDVVCPWCVIGFGRLEQALKQVSQQVDANITWHPFELNPAMSQNGENLRAHLAAKYGTTLADSIRARTMLTKLGKEVDFIFNYFDDMKMLNSHQCHQLLLWAKDSDKQTELAMALFEMFFSQQGEFTQTSLLSVVDAVGLNVQQAEEVLQNNSMSEQVQMEEKQWRQQGIQGVPAFVFNKRRMLVGAQDVDSFIEIITSLIPVEVS